MRFSSLDHLCCPECHKELGAVREDHIADSARNAERELIEGALRCTCCQATYSVVGGVPILLPSRIPNPAEQEVRQRISREVAHTAERWRDSYDRYHFRARTEFDISRSLDRLGSGPRPRVLDIGIGWGVPYLPFATELELWGIDFSLESLLLARKLYAVEGAPMPELVCASLDAIPLRGLRFDLVRSIQVYQHIPEQRTIRDSLRYVLEELIADGGELTVKNLNYRYARLPRWLRRIVRISAPASGPELTTPDYYLRYYLPRDFRSLLRGIATPRIAYSEFLFHPELRLLPRSRRAARLDAFLSKLPGTGLFARQVGATVHPVGHKRN